MNDLDKHPPMSEEELAAELHKLSLILANDSRRIGAPGSQVRDTLAHQSSVCGQAAVRILRWWEIFKDELAQTRRIMEALGITSFDDLPAGTSTMAEILARIAGLKERVAYLEEIRRRLDRLANFSSVGIPKHDDSMVVYECCNCGNSRRMPKGTYEVLLRQTHERNSRIDL